MSSSGRLLSTTLLERMSHDIRGPVGVVSFLLDELVGGSPSPEMLAEMVRRSRRSLHRLLVVADRLSRAAGLESEQIPLNLSRIELRGALRDCVAEAIRTEERPEVEVRLQLSDAPLFAELDPRWLLPAFGDTIATFVRRARRVVDLGLAETQSGFQLRLSHDGRRTRAEPDLFSDLPLALLAVTVERHGWRIDLGAHQAPDDEGFLLGGQIVIDTGGAP